ncbi:VWA domain-containing protein, partial [Candidatus Entotheonella palauensis]|uniref:VWA domain-containing protein n=1 Tax=Candidatus Entotheonella palauensis TaxID=93172 RepID=UPI0011780B27
MQWDYPWALWGLAMVPGLIYCAITLWRQKRDFWEVWCRLPFMRQQSVGPSRRRYFLVAVLLLAGFILSVLGFASPVIQRTAWEPVWENVALVLLADFSKSMEAPRNPLEANAPSRFEEMRVSLLEFLSTLPPGVKISLVPFSEYAIPITSGFSDDHSELIAKVRRFQRDFFYKQGTDLTTTLQEG